MKKIATIICAFIISNALSAQDHQLVKLWETDTLLRTPESVLYNEKGKFLFVSNIGKNGNGSIGKVGLDGKILQVDWVSGRAGPKGLGLYKNKLYVADVKEVVVIDIDKAAIIQHIPVDSAVFLNDITIDKNGVVYVSDSRKGKVHKIVDGMVTTYLEKLLNPNGLLVLGSDLYVLDKGSLLKVNTTSKQTTKIAEGMEASTDGIEQVKEGEFIISCWAGIVYYVKADGSKQVLFDNRDKKINSADIGYNPSKKIVYVPTFFGNKVVAYELK